MTHRSSLAFLAGVTVLASATPALAQATEPPSPFPFNIDFNGFPRFGGLPITIPFEDGQEEGFEIISTGAPVRVVRRNTQYFDGHAIRPVDLDTTGVLTIRREDGGQFEFSRLAYQRAAGTDVRVAGFLGGQEVTSLNAGGDTDAGVPQWIFGGFFVGQPLDELRVHIPSGADSRGFIDNILLLPLTEARSSTPFWAMEAERATIHEVNTEAETVEFVTSTGGGSNLALPSGAASLNGSFYSTNSGVSDFLGIVRIDTGNSDIENIDPAPDAADRFEAMTVDPSTGSIYGIGRDSDLLYRNGLWGAEPIEEVGVISANLTTEFGSAVGAAFDPATGVMYVVTDDMPTTTMHLWSFRPEEVGQPGFVPEYVGDTGVAARFDYFDFPMNGGEQTITLESQIGLAFDSTAGMLMMSSDEGLRCRFYHVDPATALPRFLYSTANRFEFDALAPAGPSYSVKATPAGTATTPGAIAVDARTGRVFTATDSGQLAEAFDSDLLAISAFTAGFPIGATDIEYGDAADTGAPAAVYAVSNAQMNIVPLGGPSFAVPLSSQGVTTGTNVGVTRVGGDIYFTSGVGQPGALYRFDPNTGGVTLVSAALEESPMTLEYEPISSLFYYSQIVDSTDPLSRITLQAYDPASDTSTLIDPDLETLFGNFAIDPSGTYALVALDRRIELVPLDPASELRRVVYATNLPSDRSGRHDLAFGPSSAGAGTVSLYVSTNGRGGMPAAVLEFTGFSPNVCGPADIAPPYLTVDAADVVEFLQRIDAEDPRAELDNDGILSFFDVVEFLKDVDEGCL